MPIVPSFACRSIFAVAAEFPDCTGVKQDSERDVR